MLVSASRETVYTAKVPEDDTPKKVVLVGVCFEETVYTAKVPGDDTLKVVVLVGIIISASRRLTTRQKCLEMTLPRWLFLLAL